MENCIENTCKCKKACDVLGLCAFTHPLVEDSKPYILTILDSIKGEDDKVRALLNYFHKKQPPKYQSKALMLKGRSGMVKRVIENAKRLP